MNKPSKKQLLDRITHYEDSLTVLLQDLARDGEDLRDSIKEVLATAPSLEPVQKTYREEILEVLGESVLTGVLENVVDPETPATE